MRTDGQRGRPGIGDPRPARRGFGVSIALVALVALIALVALVALASLAGCASAPERVSAARTVDLGAFSRDAEVAGPADTAETPAAPDVEGQADEPADGEPGTIATPIERPPAAPPAAQPADPVPPRVLEPGERVVVDSLVGQINGRAVFADAFFRPIQDQLRAIGRRSTPTEFANAAGEIILEELRLVVLNALFLAEAEARLTVEQEQRIFAWLGQREEEVVAERGGGSVERARETIQRSEGRTLEEYMKEVKDRALIGQLLQDRVAPRIIVSWRDVEREYERRRAEFNPPAEMTLARIRLDSEREAARIADVERRLAAGEDFMKIVESIGGPEAGVWQQIEVGGEEEAFSNEVLLEQVAVLRAKGDRTEAFALGRHTWWLAVAGLDQPPQRDLYDPQVQRALNASIRQARGSEERDRYIATLLEKGIYDELGEMAQRLLRIAIRRYGP